MVLKNMKCVISSRPFLSRGGGGTLDYNIELDTLHCFDNHTVVREARREVSLTVETISISILTYALRAGQTC